MAGQQGQIYFCQLLKQRSRSKNLFSILKHCRSIQRRSISKTVTVFEGIENSGKQNKRKSALENGPPLEHFIAYHHKKAQTSNLDEDLKSAIPSYIDEQSLNGDNRKGKFYVRQWLLVHAFVDGEPLHYSLIVHTSYFS